MTKAEMVLEPTKFTAEQRRALGKVYRLILSWKSNDNKQPISDIATEKVENDEINLTSQLQSTTAANRNIAQ